MHVVKNDISSTKVSLTISAEETTLAPIKAEVVKRLSKDVKLPGFREGTAPPALVEKNIDQKTLQADFLDEAMTQLYAKAAMQEDVRPLTRPEVNIKKFVPFTSLEFEVITHVIGPVKLADYKNLKAPKDKVSVTDKDVNEVIDSLKVRMAEKKEVDRASKDGDEVWIDFRGTDPKGAAIKGADGKDYPLLLGSNTFIPGFEDNLAGLKPGDEKTFTLTFPKDYGVKALAGKKVTFAVNVKKVMEVVKPKIDDEFASKVGPFKTVKELEDDIKKQLSAEKEREATAKQQNELVKQLVEQSSVDLPETLIEQQVTYNLDELRRNLTYRGQTMQEFLESESMNEDEYKKKVIEPQAIQQLKTSLLLNEVAEKENIQISEAEVESRIQQLKTQYQDPAMQAELDKPDTRQDIASRMRSELAVNILTS